MICSFGYYYFFRKDKKGILIFFTYVFVFFLTLKGFNNFSLWKYVYDYVPGGNALRAVARIGVCLLLFFGVGIGYFFERIQKSTPIYVVIFLAIIVILEQGTTTQSYAKVESRKRTDTVTQQIDPKCQSFFYFPLDLAQKTPSFMIHLDAMWAQINSQVPTVNGYSGKHPMGWEFPLELLPSMLSLPIEQSLKEWQEKFPDELTQGICWIKKSIP